MINAPTHATPGPAERPGPAEVTAMDIRGRGPLLLLLVSAVAWLVLSCIFALIASIQLHSPAFLADCEWLTHGRVQALRETAFVYGWAANAGLAIGLWILARLGGAPLRAPNWIVMGAFFWNLGVAAGLIGIATGDMTSFAMLQLPRYVQPLMVVAYAAMGVSGVLAWSGRRLDRTYASQWYVVAALFLFPWLLLAVQTMLFWSPVRGTLQAIAAGWYAQGTWTLWLAPLALAGAYYVVPKVTGRVLPMYEFAPLGFWTLMFIGAWTGGRHLIGGPVPAWIATVAVVASVMVLFHHLVLWFNLRVVFHGSGNALAFIRFGFIAYLLAGALAALTAFRGIAELFQFTFLTGALEMLGLHGAISMLFLGAIYYMLPRLTGRPWASAALVVGHRWLVMVGLALGIVALGIAGWIQGAALLDAGLPMAGVFERVRPVLLVATAAQVILLGASLLLLVNLLQSVCVWRPSEVSASSPFRQPANLEATAS
ncbi:MAG: cbb3-type cytochrome c oxidase subunit I [Opitutus sp.]